jgi:hypothetical protein
LIFRDTTLFSGRLSCFSWDVRLVSSQHAHQLVRSNPQLQRLVIWRPESKEFRTVELLGPSLLDLTLYGAHILDGANLASLAQSCPSLTHLFLHGIDRSHRPEGGLIAVAENCRWLESIKVYSFIISQGAVNALCTHCAKLTTVTLPGALFTNQSVALLSKLGVRLQKVTIGWAVDTLPDATSVMCFAPVRELDIDAVTPTCVAALAHALSGMSDLLSFTVGPSWHGEPIPALESAQVDILTYALQHFTNLTHISLRQRLSEDSRESLCRVFESCRALRSIYINGSCIAFTDTMVQSMAANCPWLVSTDFTAVEALSDAAIIYLAAQCPLLKALRIDAAPALTDLTLRALAEHCPCLYFVSLWQSEHLTLGGIRHLVQHCAKLVHVQFHKSCIGDGEKEIQDVMKSRQRTA